MNRNDEKPQFVSKRLSDGEVRGQRNGTVETFLSIPYAAPPIGANRFEEAQPVRPWDGVRDATKPGPTSWYKSPTFAGLD
ncbi:MAG: carboxylesterase family protein, partial [Sphingomonas sp.]|nr:carboxylesterase family protein [Sphingomonas sp.]